MLLASASHDVAPDVLIKQQALPIETDRCARHFTDVLFVGRIPFLDRESRVADRQTIGLRLTKVDLLARQVTEVVPGKGGSSQPPAIEARWFPPGLFRFATNLQTRRGDTAEGTITTLRYRHVKLDTVRNPFDGGLRVVEIGVRAIDGDHTARLDSPDLTAASVSQRKL